MHYYSIVIVDFLCTKKRINRIYSFQTEKSNNFSPPTTIYKSYKTARSCGSWSSSFCCPYWCRWANWWIPPWYFHIYFFSLIAVMFNCLLVTQLNYWGFSVLFLHTIQICSVLYCLQIISLSLSLHTLQYSASFSPNDSKWICCLEANIHKMSDQILNNYEKIPFDNDDVEYTTVTNGLTDIVGRENDSSPIIKLWFNDVDAFDVCDW